MGIMPVDGMVVLSAGIDGCSEVLQTVLLMAVKKLVAQMEAT